MKEELQSVLADLESAKNKINALILGEAVVNPPPPPPAVEPYYMALGEVAYCQGLVEVDHPHVDLSYFQETNVITLMPSYQGAPVGDHPDALVPCDKADADITRVKIKPTATAGQIPIRFRDRDETLSILPVTMDKPYPMYAELQSRNCMLAHKLPDHVSYQGPITEKYCRALRSFGIEPIKQGITVYPTSDINQWSEYGASFRQLVLDGSIFNPCLFGPSPGSRPSLDLLKRLNANHPGLWIYAWDEGEGNPALTASALDYVKWLKSNAPDLKVMVTRQWSEEFAPYVDYFCPVLDWFDSADRVRRTSYTKAYGLYTSCMAQGNCANKTDAANVRPASGTPMMVLDAPSVHRVAFPVMCQQLGAEFALYFNTTQRITKAWEPGGQYSEGGNGDGTLFYPGENGFPVPSRRLAELHLGLQIAQLASKASGLGVASPISGPYAWSQDVSKYEEYRVNLLKALARRNGWQG